MAIGTHVGDEAAWTFVEKSDDADDASDNVVAVSATISDEAASGLHGIRVVEFIARPNDGLAFLHTSFELSRDGSFYDKISEAPGVGTYTRHHRYLGIMEKGDLFTWEQVAKAAIEAAVGFSSTFTFGVLTTPKEMTWRWTSK